MRHVLLFAAALTCVLLTAPAMTDNSPPYVLVLGIAQDAGYPQAGTKGASRLGRPRAAPSGGLPGRRRSRVW